MGLSDRNLQHFFKRKDLPLSQILRAGEFLGENLLTTYVSISPISADGTWSSQQELKEPQITYEKKERLLRVSLDITGTMESMEQLPSLLKEVDEAATKRGLRII